MQNYLSIFSYILKLKLKMSWKSVNATFKNLNKCSLTFEIGIDLFIALL